LAAPSPMLAVVAVALVGGAATLLCARYRVGPPAGLMFAFATAVTSSLPATHGAVLRNVALTAAAAAFAWLVAMAGALTDRDAPRRLAVARALRAASALAGAPDGPAGLALRQQTAVAVERAWRVVRPDHLASALLVAQAETELAGLHPPDPARAAALRRLADGLIRDRRFPELEPSPGSRSAALLLQVHAGKPHRLLWPPAARVAVGGLVAGTAAGALAHVTGLGHPYWAAVSAVAVLQAASLRVSFQRALQRAGGTIAGLLLAGIAVGLPGGHWTLVAAIIAGQVIAELLVIRNYGLAMLAVTPIALLVGELAQPTPALTLVGDRLAQTVLGCVLGLACAALVATRAAARHLDTSIAAVELATTRLRDALEADPTPAARELAMRLRTMRDAYDVATGEPGLPPAATERVLNAEREARTTLLTVH
ncbi:MAG: FUSC family protein, partial [Actinoplanes sp.]